MQQTTLTQEWFVLHITQSYESFHGITSYYQGNNNLAKNL